MAVPAAIPQAMRAAGTLAVRMAGQHQASLGSAAVDPAEAGRGEGHEQPRMLTDAVRDALAPLKAGGEQLVGVGSIGGCAGWALGLAAGAARLKEHSVRLSLGVIDRADFAGRAVGVLDPAGQADGVVAVAGLGDQLGPPVVAVPGAVHDLGQHPWEHVAHAGRVGHAGSSSTSRSVGAVVLVEPRSASARRASSARSRSSSQQDRSRTGTPPSWSRSPTPRAAGSMLAAE